MSALAASPLPLPPPCNVLLRTKTSLQSFKVTGGQTEASLDEAPPSTESPCALLKFSPAGDVAVVKETKGTGDVHLVASDPVTGSLALGSSTVLEGTATVQAADFSPKGTFLTTWQRPSKEAGAPPNLKVFEVATGKMVAAFNMKNPAVPGVSWPAVEWSSDEKVAMRIATNTLFIHRGDSGWEDGNVLERVSVEGIKQVRVCEERSDELKCKWGSRRKRGDTSVMPPARHKLLAERAC